MTAREKTPFNLLDRDGRWYFAGQMAYFASAGVQNMLFAWLVTIHLHKPPELVGVAQMAAMLPMPFLLLFGGAAADRRDLRHHLIHMQLLMLIPQGCLMLAIAAGWLSYPLLICFILMVGTVGAFAMPARDAALPFILRRSGGDFSRGIALATGIQFGGQIAGLALGGFASQIGPVPLLATMMLCIGFASFSVWKLRQLRPAGQMLGGTAKQMVHEIREGLVEALSSERIRTVLIVFSITSILFMGVFMVLLPVMVRDIYGGSSPEMSIANISFMVGVMIATGTLMNVRPIQHQGRAMMLAMLGSFSSMILFHLHPPLIVFYIGFVLWGMAGGVAMSMSRSIVQGAAPESHQARIASIYQLANMGGAPIGALGFGFLIQWLGVLNALLVPAAGVAILWVVMFFFSPVWKIQRIATTVPEEIKGAADAADAATTGTMAG